MMPYFRSTAAAVFLLFWACLAAPAALAAGAEDAVVFSFAFVGDSRSDKHAQGLTAQDAIWLQSTKPLARIIREVAQARPQAIFFGGDMIRGHSRDPHVLDRQYGYWRGMMATLMEAGVYVVPVVGNHETHVAVADGSGNKHNGSIVENEQAWRANMGDLIMDAGRWRQLTGGELSAWDVADTPPIGGKDGATTDQRQLTYSFDAAGSHFAIVNTDAVGADGLAPTHWLEEDLARAKARGCKRLFVFGHRQAFTFSYAKEPKPSGLDTNPAQRDAFWDVIERYQAAYFCGHQHLYHPTQPRKEQGGKAWQILVGSAGAPFSIKPEKARHPMDRMFAWVQVDVRQSGTVRVRAYGFGEDYGKTELIQEWEM